MRRSDPVVRGALLAWARLEDVDLVFQRSDKIDGPFSGHGSTLSRFCAGLFFGHAADVHCGGGSQLPDFHEGHSSKRRAPAAGFRSPIISDRCDGNRFPSQRRLRAAHHNQRVSVSAVRVDLDALPGFSFVRLVLPT